VQRRSSQPAHHLRVKFELAAWVGGGKGAFLQPFGLLPSNYGTGNHFPPRPLF
jgi:hypothetical protein